MVIGTLTGSELDLPNSPENGDEFQARTKFVYEWSGDNRWKNIHRPLYIPDYIWDSDQPPTADGGGGDDWTREAFEIDVNNGKSIIYIYPEMNLSAGSDPATPGSIALEEVDDARHNSSMLSALFIGDEKAKYPNVASKGTLQSATRRSVGESSMPTGVYLAAQNPGTKWFVFAPLGQPEYDSSAPCMWIELDEVLSEYGFANLDEVRVRLTLSGNYVGKTFAAIYRQVSIRLYSELKVVTNNDSNIYVDVTGLGTGPTTQTTGWSNLQDWGRYLTLEGRIAGGYAFGDVILEIEDPGGVTRGNPPIGLWTDPTGNWSYISFGGLTGSVMRSLRHGNPNSLENSNWTDIVDGEDVLDLTGAATGLNWTCMWGRSDGNWYATVDSEDTNVVIGRHLFKSFDITTHSDVYNDVTNGYYDYKDYGSETPDLGVSVSGIYMKPDGTVLYVMTSTGVFRAYTLGSAWDLSTVDDAVYETYDAGWGQSCFTISHDGYVLAMAKAGKVKQIVLDTAWDITTAIDTGFDRDFTIEEPVGISISSDGYSLMILDIPSNTDENFKLYNYTRNA